MLWNPRRRCQNFAGAVTRTRTSTTTRASKHHRAGTSVHRTRLSIWQGAALAPERRRESRACAASPPPFTDPWAPMRRRGSSVSVAVVRRSPARSSGTVRGAGKVVRSSGSHIGSQPAARHECPGTIPWPPAAARPRTRTASASDSGARASPVIRTPADEFGAHRQSQLPAASLRADLEEPCRIQQPAANPRRSCLAQCPA